MSTKETSRCRSGIAPALVMAGVALVLSGCAGPITVRDGEPVPTPGGPPEGACEERAWLEIAPSITSARNMVGYGSPSYGGYTYVESSHRRKKGYSVYEVGSNEPIPLEDLLPRMDEPGLTQLHMGRIRPIQRRYRIARGATAVGGTWLGVSVAGVLAGAGVMLATSELPYDHPRSDLGLQIMLGSTVSVLGALVPMLFAVLVRPAPADTTYMQVRERAFIPGEDDMDAVVRGVARVNARRRQRCQAR